MKKHNKKDESKIICESSLQAFFFDKLFEINQKSSFPVSAEVLFYSSKVLDTYSSPGKCFENEDGKIKNKVLGVKLLESEKMAKSKRKKALRDIGDTALVICGFFYESLNRKLFHVNHYHEVGKSAYSKLDGIVVNRPSPSIYQMMSESFDRMANMISVISKGSFGNKAAGDILYIVEEKNRIKAS